MLSLVYKDFLLQRGAKSLIYMLVMPLLSAFTLSGDILYTILPYIAGSYLYIVYANALDDKYHSEKLLIAMPVGRYTIIGAKYLGVMLYMVAFILMIGVIQKIIGLLALSAIPVSELEWHHIVQFITIAAIYYGIFFPIYFKLGYQRSRWANYISLLAAAGLFALATRGLTSISGTDITSLQKALKYLTGIGETLWNALLPLLSVVIITFSVYLSGSFYRRREF